MTPQDHNKVIGIMHLIYGGFNVLMLGIFVPIFLALGAGAAADPNAPPAIAAIFGIFGFVMLFLALIFGLPSILAGYAMLRHKSWARVMAIIAAVAEAISFPFGTALCVYTFWFLFGQQNENFHRAGGGGQVYGRQGWQSPPLPDASTYGWDAQRAPQQGRQRDYVPPPQPPDWRGQ
jgi:hypothetical protein